MSTRSNIYLKVSKETKGKTVKFNKNLLPNNEKHTLNYSIPDMKISKNTDYIGVYCHSDGYISGVGKELIENYDTYDKVLNLLALGDLSSICGGARSYLSWRNEKGTETEEIDETCERITYSWKNENEHEEKKIPAIIDGKLNAEWAVKEEYAYLFDGENWYVAYYWFDNLTEKSILSEWKPLANEMHTI